MKGMCLEIVEAVLRRGQTHLDGVLDEWAKLPNGDCGYRINSLFRDPRTAPWLIDSRHPVVINFIHQMDDRIVFFLIRQLTNAQVARLISRLTRWDHPKVIEEFFILRCWSLYRTAYLLGGRIQTPSLRLQYAAEIFPIFRSTSRAKNLVTDVILMIYPYLSSP